MKTIAMTAPGGPEVPKLREPLARRWMFVISLALFMIYASSTKADDIYRCNDEKGRIVFSDKPCAQDAEKIQIKNPRAPSSGVRLRLFHNGEPIKTITKAVPHFSLEMEKDGNYARYFQASPLFDRFPKRYNPSEDTYSIMMDVSEEGSYAGYVAIDANTKNPTNYPGDYLGGYIILSKEMNEIFNVSLNKIIHLLQPQDNNAPLLPSVHKCDNVFSTKAPLRILWDSLGPNVKYNYEIKPLTCKPACCRPELFVVNTSTTDTFVTHDLPVNKEDEIYSLTVEAWDTVTNKHVGSLIIHDERGYTTDYRFRIVE